MKPAPETPTTERIRKIVAIGSVLIIAASLGFFIRSIIDENWWITYTTGWLNAMHLWLLWRANTFYKSRGDSLWDIILFKSKKP
jgi:hypothetical protein